jgi:hypothetical protein
MRRKKKRHPSNSHSKEKDSNRKGRNNNHNINPSVRNAREMSAASRAPVEPKIEGSVHSDDDDDDDDEYCKDSPPMTSVLSAVVKVPQKPALYSNIDDGVMKAHIDSGEHKDSTRKGKKHHRQNR